MSIPVVSHELGLFAERHLGSGLTFEYRGWPMKVSLIWRVTIQDGRAFYIKQHESEKLFDQHLFACRQWVSKLPTGSVPELVAASPDVMAMIFTELPGRVMDRVELPPVHQQWAHRRAGEIARTLHGLPYCDPSASQLPEQMAAQVEETCERAQGLVDDTTLRWAVDIFDGGRAFAEARRVPCHRDYSPRNWIVSVDGSSIRWGLIDFERSRADIWLQDIQRMWFGHWTDRPDLRDAFFDGYGRGLSDNEMTWLRLIALRVAIGTVAWARDNGDAAFEESGRSTIRQLQREL